MKNVKFISGGSKIPSKKERDTLARKFTQRTNVWARRTLKGK